MYSQLMLCLSRDMSMLVDIEKLTEVVLYSQYSIAFIHFHKQIIKMLILQTFLCLNTTKCLF